LLKNETESTELLINERNYRPLRAASRKSNDGSSDGVRGLSLERTKNSKMSAGDSRRGSLQQFASVSPFRRARNRGSNRNRKYIGDGGAGDDASSAEVSPLRRNPGARGILKSPSSRSPVKKNGSALDSGADGSYNNNDLASSLSSPYVRGKRNTSKAAGRDSD